ncbi:hypothetical protein O0I10_011463 [Lichtheimia ornata]|uniref:Uncharacterized protein n=1 Tax=Lichtheimia ornata TaxID=688661 RepID=A0AAD7UST5_9FUNG|nr:uncharacterized protein O0I10_011463 [Lichtheimia ornata]KAJ8652863.1 hypothetical protein O0I10_011463 [Lichtheimia ornata]
MVNEWSSLTEQPILAIKSGTCPNVVADSTRHLQQSVQEHLTHLDNRARALANSANFEAALNDVARIRQLVPSSAMGYLCGGHVYSLQGHQKAAIDVYDQGLAAVSSSDPSHQRLVEARSMAQERDSICIDFIKEFPIDIIENIAPRILCEGMIAPNEIRQYLDVSRVWRERLLLCIRELHLESMADDDLADDDDLLEQVAPHCTALTLQIKAHGLPRLVSKTQFPSLQTLIANVPRANDDDDDDSNPGIAALVSLGSTLTHLEITTSAYGVWLGEILSSCPNLVHLQMDSVDTDMDKGPECHPNLKRLLFLLYDEDSDIDDITKRLPGLEVFVANPFYETEDLKILQDNCPNLKVVGCNDYDASYFYVPTTTTTTRRSQNYGDQQDCIGVHTFYVDCYEYVYWTVDLKDVMDFMRRNSHTLQHVYFYIDLGGGDDNVPILNHVIQAADGALFKSMTTFVNCIGDYSDILLTRWVVRESPHLKEIKLILSRCYRPHEIDTSALFDDLIGHCELESVIFELHGNPTTMDMEGAERFIRYHVTFDSLLHTLTLPKHTRLSKDALDVLARLPRLRNLSFCWPLMKEDQEEEGDHEKCSDFIGKLDRLQHLEICSDELVPDDVFLQLSKLNIISLNLYIPILKLPTPTILLSLLQCPNLQKLFVNHFIREEEPLIYEIRNMLENKIEKVHFRKYTWWTYSAHYIQ